MSRGERLRRLRQQAGVDQAQAAAAIQISRPYLSLLERDEKGHNLDHVRATLERAAAYYGVNSDYLLVETPQEYIKAFIGHLGANSPPTFAKRLSLVLSELSLRWNEDVFGPERVAAALGTTVDGLNDLMADGAQITDTVVQKLSRITGAPADWLIPPVPIAVTGQAPEAERLVQLALEKGMTSTELETLIWVWLAARDTRQNGAKKPSG